MATKPTKALTMIVAVIFSGFAIMASTASATVLTDGSGNQLGVGTSFTAEAEAALTWHPPFGSIACHKSHIGGKTTNSGGEGVNVSANVEALSWSECNATMTVLKKGTLSIAWTSGSNGTLTSTGTELTTSYLGYHCVFSTNGTKLGTLTGSSVTKGNATLDISATIPRTWGESGAFCGSTAQWTGAYKFTAPSTLNIDDASPPVNTILTDGSKSQLKTGTSITAESEGTTIWHPPFGSIECGNSHFGGKTANDGGGGDSVDVTVENLTWSQCNGSLTVLSKGSLSIAWTSGSNGALASSGTELTAQYLGFHCIFSTNGTKLGTLTGSATTGSSATLDISATIPRTGGSSGAFCGSTAQWTGSYKFTAPSVLNID